MADLEFTEHHGPMDDFASLIVQLTATILRSGIDKHGAINSETKEEIRRIGSAIHEKFGFQGMQTADNALFQINELASVRVDKLWNGIGSYVA
jgi:hypothetical protein